MSSNNDVVRRCITVPTYLALFGVACAPVITKRFAELKPPEKSRDVMFTVTGSAFPIEASGRSIFDLAAEGQAAAIEAMAARLKPEADLHAAMAAPLLSAPRAVGVRDAATFSRRVVLSVEATHSGPADRLEDCTVELVLDDASGARFKSWNQLTTRFETIDLGKLTFTQKGALGASIETLAPGSTEIEKASLTGSLERAMGEEVTLRRRFVASSGVLTDRRARIVQQGAVGIDLVGNIVLDITVTADRVEATTLWHADDLFTAGGQPETPKKVRLSSYQIRYATDSGRGWYASIKGTARRRTVVSGQETVTESDDHIRYADIDDARSSVLLVQREDLRVSRWHIEAGDGSKLHVVKPGGDPEPLAFDSFENAVIFRAWLMASGATDVGARRLGFMRGSPAKLTSPKTAPRWSGLHVTLNEINWNRPKPRD